jgi:hypothetical protein
VSAILQAVSRLNGAVSKLEVAVVQQEKATRASSLKKSAVGQSDLFSAPAANQRGKYVADPVALARKLDVAIEKVEQILREA